VERDWQAEYVELTIMVNEHMGGRQRQSYHKIEVEDLAKAGVSRVDALEKAKWIRAVRKVEDMEIRDPVDDPM
jgi:hypothetical protein